MIDDRIIWCVFCFLLFQLIWISCSCICHSLLGSLWIWWLRRMLFLTDLKICIYLIFDFSFLSRLFLLHIRFIFLFSHTLYVGFNQRLINIIKELTIFIFTLPLFLENIRFLVFVFITIVAWYIFKTLIITYFMNFVHLFLLNLFFI